MLGEQIPVLHETIKTSIIQNQELQIFERQISENEENVVGKALFDIINEVKDIEYNKKVPTVKINDKKCGNCEYKNICLKE